MDVGILLQSAREARKKAYAPYSGFCVGAALLTSTGRIFDGCNVENKSYSLCTCAERTAIVSAVAAGERYITALAVVGNQGSCVPCGACLQIMAEFNRDMQIITEDETGCYQVRPLTAYLPILFSLPPAEKN